MASFDFDTAALVAGLERASLDIKREVGTLLEEAALGTQRDVQAAYPIGPTGRLKRQVYLTQPRSFSTSGDPSIRPRQVRAAAPHVHIYQGGTRERFDATRSNARRGVSPAHGPIFERLAASNRSRFFAQAQSVLERSREIV